MSALDNFASLFQKATSSQRTPTSTLAQPAERINIFRPQPNAFRRPREILSFPVGGYLESGGYGASFRSDPFSGRPLLSRTNPQGTVLEDRVAAKFDITKPQKLTRDVLSNERMPLSASQALRAKLGAGYDEQLDHLISLQLSGSNVESNLRVQKLNERGVQPLLQLENKLGRDVVAGRVSLESAHREIAAAKGITLKEDQPTTTRPQSAFSKVLNKVANFEREWGVKFLSALTPTSPFTPFSPFQEAGAKVAKDIGQSVLRSFAATGLTILLDATQNPEHEIWEVPKELQPFFGADKINNLGTQVLELERGIKESSFAQREGFDKIAMPLAFGGVVLGTGLDLTIFPGGEKNLIKFLAKETNIRPITAILRRLGFAEDIIKEFAPKIVSISTDAEVKAALKVMQGMQGLSKAQTPSRFIKDAMGRRVELKPQATRAGVRPDVQKMAQEEILNQGRLLSQAKIGQGGFQVGEVYKQRVAGGTRPIQITKVNPDGSVEGWYLGSMSKTEADFGIGPASLTPAKWTDPARELEKISISQSRLEEFISKVFKNEIPGTARRAAARASIPPELQPLAQEARKYKSAEEFVSAVKGKTIEIDPKSITIEDFENLRDAKMNLKAEPFKGSISDAPPVKLVLNKEGKLVLENGHHRYVAALEQNRPLKAQIYADSDDIPQLTDFYNQAVKRTDEIPGTAGSLAPESRTLQQAQEDLARSVAKPGIQKISPPLKISYEQSITEPLIGSKEVQQALILDEVAKTVAETTAKEPGAFASAVKGAEEFKDISGFKGQTRDVYRNFRAFFGRNSVAEREILDKFDDAKGTFVSEEAKLLSALKKEIVEGLGIKQGSKESAAVMDFGEGFRTEGQLVKEFGGETAERIVKADNWFRRKYNDLLDEVNMVRAQIYPDNPDKIIPKRANYYRHFQELGGLGGLKNIFETPAGIDPALAGISPFTRPKSKFLSFAQRRLGLQSERDAVGGFLEYIPSFAYAKHIDPQIGQFRELAQDLAVQTQNSRNANNFIEFLHDFANDLSGKTNAADRFIQKVVPGGRKTMAVVDWLNKRVKANTILGNLSSSVAQIFNVPQGIASSGRHSVPGVLRTLGSIFQENVPMRSSTFIKERYSRSMFNAFDTGILAQPRKFASWLTGVLDEVGTKFIWNAHYAQGLGRKVADPIRYADKATRALVAGRGVGEVPLIQKSKLFQIVAPFQLEVGNLWYVMGDFVGQKQFGKLATLFVSMWFMNRIAEKVRGSDVGFDPINAVYEGVNSLIAEEDKLRGSVKLGGRLGGEVLSNLPLGQTLAALYPEKGFGDITREDLFGEGDPTRFGGGLVATRGLQDPLFKVLPSFGGAQLKKTLQGIAAFEEGEELTPGGRVRYKIPQTPENFFRAALFGKSSLPAAQEYYDSLGEGGTTATKKTTNMFRP